MNDTPQLENGHFLIATEIYEALAKTRIPGEARQVLDFIIRKTYGWHKKEDRISLSQFTEGTGLKKPTICKAINKLKEMNLIITKKDNSITQKGNDYIVTYCFNKSYNNWNLLPKKVTLPKKVIPITQKDNLPLPKKIPTKDTITKDKLPLVPVRKKPEPEEIDLKLSDLLLELLTANKPDRKQNSNEVINWANSVRLMRQQDNRTPQRIEAVIRWCQKDSFEMGVVLSMSKLRDRFDNLEMKMKKYGHGLTDNENGNGFKPDITKQGTLESMMERDGIKK